MRSTRARAHYRDAETSYFFVFNHRFIEKGVDIALASDVLSLATANAYDVAIIVSGYFDFHQVIDDVQRQGLIVEVAYFKSQGINKEMTISKIERDKR